MKKAKLRELLAKRTEEVWKKEADKFLEKGEADLKLAEQLTEEKPKKVRKKKGDK